MRLAVAKYAAKSAAAVGLRVSMSRASLVGLLIFGADDGVARYERTPRAAYLAVEHCD